MGIPTLITTNTLTGAAASAFTSSIDSTYDEYMFVFTDIGPSANGVTFRFQVSIDGGSNYNVAITSTHIDVDHREDGSNGSIQHGGGQGQGTAYEELLINIGNASDESAAGILHLFGPSSTTYMKQFFSRGSVYHGLDDGNYQLFTAGYINTTSAVNAINFKIDSGTFDGVIQMYGIA